MFKLRRKTLFLSLSLFIDETNKERLGNLPKITQLVSSRDGLSTDPLPNSYLTPQPDLSLPCQYHFSVQTSGLPPVLDIPVRSHLRGSAPSYLFLCSSWDTGKKVGLGVRDAGSESRLDTD